MKTVNLRRSIATAIRRRAAIRRTSAVWRRVAIRRRVATTALVGLVLAAAFLTGCGATNGGTGAAAGGAVQGAPGAEAAVAVRVQLPERRTIERRVSYVGTVHAGHVVHVIARVGGTVTEIPVPEGGHFSAGDVLARLSAPELQAAVERLEAELEYWTRRLETDRRLVEREAVPAEQADASERAWRSARAALAEAQAQLDKTVIRAPFDGTMLDVLIDPGQPLMPGQPLVLIGDPSRELRVDVIEEDLHRGIDVGTEAELLTGSEVVRSSVTNISSVSSGPARTFTVTIPLSGAPGMAEHSASSEGGVAMPRKGASLRADFILERAEAAVAVPLRAVGDRDGRPHLFVIGDGHAWRREATLGVSQDGWIAAHFDWDGESPVAITNVNSLRDGARVFAVDAGGVSGGATDGVSGSVSGGATGGVSGSATGGAAGGSATTGEQ